jgi:CxxC motif-containing protein (DUF1111 family)
MTEQAKPFRLSLRKSPSLFGSGLIEVIPDEVIAEAADPEDANRDGISGRIPNGRFGWKGRFRTLDQAVTAAFVNELGLENDFFPITPLFGRRPPSEVSLAQVDAVLAFVRSLPPLTAKSSQADIEPGRVLFEQIGCAACHTPVIGTATSSQLRPYTDLLLHNLGLALADGFEDADTAADEFKTPPLWGVAKTGPPYLHDGRASDLNAAVISHGGEAAPSAERYKNLPNTEKAALISFLNSL